MMLKKIKIKFTENYLSLGVSISQYEKAYQIDDIEVHSCGWKVM